MSVGPNDLKMVAHQIEPGEPYLLLRGNDPMALDLVTHRLAKMSVRAASTEDLMEAADLVNAFKTWNERKR